MMTNYLLLLLLAIITSAIPADNITALTIQCDRDDYGIANHSSDFLPKLQHVHQLVLEECALETIPDILSNILLKVTKIKSLLLKGMKQHPIRSFPHHYQCSPVLKSVSRVKLVGTGGSESDDYSAVVGYLSQCTSVISLSILSTSLACVMRLESGAALQSLRLTNNHIAELQMEDFQALTKLRVLDLARNKLVRIPSRVFTNNRRLSRLCLARNIISFITRQSFLGRIIHISFVIPGMI